MVVIGPRIRGSIRISTTIKMTGSKTSGIQILIEMIIPTSTKTRFKNKIVLIEITKTKVKIIMITKITKKIRETDHLRSIHHSVILRFRDS